MMKDRNGLSIFKFVKNNKKKVFIVVISLSICIMGIYLTNFLLQSIKETSKPVYFKVPQYVAYADLSGTSLGISPDDYTNDEYAAALNERREEVGKLLEEIEGIKRVNFTQCLNGVINYVIGKNWYEQPLLEKELIPDYLETIHAKLISGRLPENPGEIVLDSVVLKNNNLKVGDYYLEEIWNKGFKIVGELESDSYALCGIHNGFMNSGWYFVIEHDGSITDLESVFEKIGININSNDYLGDLKNFKIQYKNEVANIIDSIIDYMFFGITALISFAILILFISFIRERENELCLYSSIGYSRYNIYGLIMKELGFMYVIAIMVSLAITYVAMILLDRFMFVPKGLVCYYNYPNAVIAIIAILVIVLGILQLPIIYTVSTIRTVDKMED